jgi:hypothetical protein
MRTPEGYRKRRSLIAQGTRSRDLANIIALKWIKQELSDAVRVAESAADGQALAGGLVKQDGKLNFVVVIATSDRLKEVMLEPPKVGQRSTQH